MFGTNIPFQVAAVFVLFIIIIDYSQNPHLKLLSNKYFEYLVSVVSINLVIDTLTIFIVTHAEAVPEWLNNFFYQLFLASIILGVFFIYLYMTSLANEQKRLEKKKLVFAVIPFIVACLAIMFGKINYQILEDGSYSYGQMVIVVYTCVIIYLIACFYISYNKKNILTAKQRKSIRIGLIIWIITLDIQELFPMLLLTGLGFVLLVLAVYFSFENQKENFDVQTKSFNRNAFNKMMAEYYENGRPLFLINVVCDNYSRINTLLGHDKGIEALIYVKEIIAQNLSGDIYHSRSNVFSVFCEDIKKLQKNLERLEYSLEHSDFKFAKLSCRINIIDIRRYTDNKDDVYELINFMTDTSGQEEGIISYLNEKIVQQKARRDKIDQLLTNAIENGGFEMYYQPIYWPEADRIKSAEALIRLRTSSDNEYISPEEFIPIAEEKGMIIAIGDKVIEMVAEFIRDNNLELSELEYIEINLSGIQAICPGIEKRILEILKRYDVSPSFINLEITETASNKIGSNFSENMEKLKALGFSFSMDDFGTGYSNLSQITKIQYDLVKLDKSLIWPVFSEDNGKAMDILDSIVSMLKKLGIAIVAEGVETKEMKEYLSELGIQHLQGYYFSKPVNKRTFLKMLRSQHMA